MSTQQGYQVLSRAVPSSELFAIREGVPGILTDAFDPLSHGGIAYADLASSFDGGTIALVDETRTQLFTGPRNGLLTAVETGLTNLRRPQFVLGVAWVLGDDATGRPVLLRVLRDTTTEQVILDDEPGERIEGFAVSPTGSRIALILAGPGGRKLGVATVMSTTPARVVAWRELALLSGGKSPVTDVTSVAWADEMSLALIGTADADLSVFTTKVDGSGIQDLSPPSEEPASITALARQGGGPIAVLTDGGTVWRYDARTRWSRIGDDMDAIGYSG
ncbi:hypothetical protein G7085_00730 [Tessaracoccus sp. HDW20]|uniref:LpqB family beta-propeller domain-containing protein n=1 Tax=Tessaracoccus coleopterorum TaxID=2714950 RepID=UPI0018D30792|nr:LpqB family beta-propeller domain-containing protein [Tessaracoccus coleopterorum]NHB83719.1 hypothetical protein [Tessaracoccus coleopterorum]